MSTQRPDASEYGEFYAGYVAKVPAGDVIQILDHQLRDVLEFWRSIPESSASLVHPPYTWNVRQVLDHLVDGERVFGYRLFRISRGDETPLAGYDENSYAQASEEHPAPLASIVESFEMLRRANMNLIRNLPEAAWNRTGTTNNCRITTRALIFILAGHVFHHDVILRKRLAAQ